MSISVVHDTFVLDRTYPTDPARLFAAWSDPEQKPAWFADEASVAEGGTYTLDFRVGGREHFDGVMKDGGTVAYDAVYQDVVPNERIVSAYDMHLRGARISVSLTTVEFSAVPGGTRLVLTEQGAYLDGLDTPQQREAGTATFLENLRAFLAG
jgi:uncharacterized protein YndB with AHSA1/START domain